MMQHPTAWQWRQWLVLALPLGPLVAAADSVEHQTPPSTEEAADHLEIPDDPFVAVDRTKHLTSPGHLARRGSFTSVQVNVDANGFNIVGDAANEPSIAVDPLDPTRIAIGWRQFDTITSNFRQAGFGYSIDGGQSWTSGVIDPGVFRSDPVLDVDSSGRFFYNSLESDLTCDVFTSLDGGASWGAEIYAFGGDKAWMTVDRSGGPGDGQLYSHWSPVGGCCDSDMFNRSTDAGASFEPPVETPGNPRRGTSTVGPAGEVFVTGHSLVAMDDFQLAKSTTVEDPEAELGFDFVTSVDLGGPLARAVGPNPAGVLGQVWVAAGADPDTVYLLASVDPAGPDPMDVHFARSVDGGKSFGAPIRINDDALATNTWQWFGTLSVAPNGRLDAVWADSRSDPGSFDSALYYASSTDGGISWSANVAISPPFDPHLGWPQQNKIGDYYHMVSADDRLHLAYSATFNGEQDVYYLQLSVGALFGDGFETGDTTLWSSTVP